MTTSYGIPVWHTERNGQKTPPVSAMRRVERVAADGGRRVHRVHVCLGAMLAISLGLSACATTEISGVRNPEFSDASYDKIVAIAVAERIHDRVRIEQAVCEEVEFAAETACSLATEVFGDIGQLTSGELGVAIADGSYDAALFLGASRMMEAEKITGQLTTYNPALGIVTTTPTRRTDKERDFGAELYDTAAASQVWRAEATVSSQGATTDHMMLSSFASSLVDEMASERLLSQSSE